MMLWAMATAKMAIRKDRVGAMIRFSTIATEMFGRE